MISRELIKNYSIIFFFYIIENPNSFFSVREKHWKNSRKTVFHLSLTDVNRSRISLKRWQLRAWCQSVLFSARLALLFKEKPTSIPSAVFLYTYFSIFFFNSWIEKFWVFLFFSVGHTPRPISMQHFKSPPLLEVSENFDISVSQCVSEAKAYII